MMLRRIVLDGRVALCAPPAAMKTVIDRPTTPMKTVIGKKEGDRVCCYREGDRDILSPALSPRCPLPKLIGGQP